MMKIDIRTAAGTVFSAFNLKGAVCLAALAVSILVSAVLLAVSAPGAKRVFIFESFDSPGLFAEVRSVLSRGHEPAVVPFVDELVLGPVNDRFLPLFPRGTKVESCFVRGNELFVDLSEEALFSDKITASFEQTAAVFKKNIFKNFSNIDIIHIYIGGRSIYGA